MNVFNDIFKERVYKHYKISYCFMSREMTPAVKNTLHKLSKKMNYVFTDKLIDMEYVSKECMINLRKKVFKNSSNTLTYTRLDGILFKNSELKCEYFNHILAKKNAIDLEIIKFNNNMRT